MRFTIRDVLWLTVVVGMAVGWRVDRQAVFNMKKTDTFTVMSFDELAKTVLEHGDKALIEMDDNGNISVRKLGPPSFDHLRKSN